MKTWLLILSLALSGAAFAADTSKGYEAFPLVRSRNIFDPNRKPPPKKEEQPRTVTPSRPRSVHLSLTGTMVTDSKRLAFFTGSRSEFNKVASVGDRIGDLKVTAISGAQVELDHGGKHEVLGVGKRLQLEGTEADASENEAAPAVSGEPAPPAASGHSSGSGNSESAKSSAPAPAPAAPGNPSDVLKRMMERRAQEMKK